ncbi:WD40-repeat-containing domain protein [Xylaria scruposa]|nr:WD40-repeat-containing domain protein [Xylaria scruposa]
MGDATAHAISSDAKFVAASISDVGVWVWNIHTSQLVVVLEGSGRVSGIVFSSNGRNLVSFNSSTIKIWDLGVLEELAEEGLEVESCIKMREGRETSIRSVALTSDTRWVLSGSVGGNVPFSNRHTGETQFLIRGYSGSADYVATSPISEYFAIGSSDGQVQIWSYNRI